MQNKRILCTALIVLSCLAANQSYTATFQYDALGRAVCVTYPGAGSAGADIVITYEYDAAENRTERIVSHACGVSNSAPTASLLVPPFAIEIDLGDSIFLKTVFSASDPDANALTYELTGNSVENSYFTVSGVNRGKGPISLSHSEFLLVKWKIANEYDTDDNVSFRAWDGALWSNVVSIDIETPDNPPECEEEEEEC